MGYDFWPIRICRCERESLTCDYRAAWVYVLRNAVKITEFFFFKLGWGSTELEHHRRSLGARQSKLAIDSSLASGLMLGRPYSVVASDRFEQLGAARRFR